MKTASATITFHYWQSVYLDSPGGRRLRALVRRITWQPCTDLWVTQEHGCACLRVGLVTTCAYGGGPTHIFAVESFPDAWLAEATDREILNAVRASLLRLAAHEADEWLTLDGTRHPYDPHLMPADPSPFPPRRKRRLSHSRSKV